MELLRLEKAPRSSSPTFNHMPITATEPPRATCAQFLDGDSATSLGSLFHCLTTLPMKKFSLISKTTAPQYCQTSFAIHALVWRERGAAGTVDWSWEKLRAKTPRISALSLQDGVWGPGAFPKCPQGPWGVPAAQDWICQWDTSREQRHQCPNICRNWRAPGLPAHPQEPHWQPDLKSLRQSLEVFVQSARKDSTFLTLQPAHSSTFGWFKSL